MHDWWCYLAVSAFGRVLFDPQPAILYRQHADNTVGVTTSSAVRMIHKIRRQLRQDSLRLLKAQAGDFAERFGPALDPTRRDLVERFIAARTASERLSLARERSIFRQFPLDDALLRLRLLIG